MELQTKLLLILIFIFLISFVTSGYFQYLSEKSKILNNLQRETKNVRCVLMATRRVYHHQFLNSEIPLTEKALGFLPAYSMSRISADFKNWTENSLYFYSVSDRPCNADDTVDTFEEAAIRFFRENPTRNEMFICIKSKEDELFSKRCFGNKTNYGMRNRVEYGVTMIDSRYTHRIMVFG